MKKFMGFRHLLPLALAGLLCVGLCACKEEQEPEPDPITLVLDQTALTLEEGQQATLTAQVNGYDGEWEVVWETDSEFVTLAPDGQSVTVTAVTEGEAKITASATLTGEEGEITLPAECTVTVQRPALYVYVPEGKLVLRKNVTVTVKAFANSTLTGEAVWTTSDPAIATVESQGLIARVTAVSNGECEIKVSYGGRECSFTLVCGLN